jgi:hypothetical protein
MLVSVVSLGRVKGKPVVGERAPNSYIQKIGGEGACRRNNLEKRGRRLITREGDVVRIPGIDAPADLIDILDGDTDDHPALTRHLLHEIKQFHLSGQVKRVSGEPNPSKWDADFTQPVVLLNPGLSGPAS